MRSRSAQFAGLSLLFLVATAAAGDQRPLRGFTLAHSAAQRALEQKFMQSLDPERARSLHQSLTMEPHIAGSVADRRTAEYVLQQLRSYGIQAEIESFPAVLSDPGEVRFDLLSP